MSGHILVCVGVLFYPTSLLFFLSRGFLSTALSVHVIVSSPALYRYSDIICRFGQSV